MLATPQSADRSSDQDTAESAPPAKPSGAPVDDSAALRADLQRVRQAVRCRARKLGLTPSPYYAYVDESETDLAALVLAEEKVLGVTIDESLHTAERIANTNRRATRKNDPTHGPDSSIPTTAM